MRRDEVAIDAPGRRHQGLAAGGLGELLVHGDDRLDHRGRLVDVPVEIEAALAGKPPAALEAQSAVGGVDALSEPGHHVLERPVVADGRVDERQEGLHAGVGSGGMRQPVGNHVGEAAVLDPELALVRLAVEEVDGAGDGRPLGRLHPARGVERGRQEVAVAAPAVAEARAQLRQGARHIPTMQHQLGGAHRSRRYDHQPGGRGAGLAAALVEVVEADLVAALGRLDAGHQMQGADLRLVALGDGEVVAIQRVARLHVAADVAVAQMHAGALLDAVLVGEGAAEARIDGRATVGSVVGPVWIEGDGDVHLLEAVAGADGVGGLAHQLHAQGPLVIRHLLHVHDVAHPGIVRRHRVPGDLGGPAPVENGSVRRGRDVGVDHRASADRGTGQYRHMLEDAQVEPAVPQLGRFLAEPPRIGVLARVFRGAVLTLVIPAPTALEHQHAHAGLGQPTCADRAAKAAADDDCVEVHRVAPSSARQPGDVPGVAVPQIAEEEAAEADLDGQPFGIAGGVVDLDRAQERRQVGDAQT